MRTLKTTIIILTLIAIFTGCSDVSDDGGSGNGINLVTTINIVTTITSGGSGSSTPSRAPVNVSDIASLVIGKCSILARKYDDVADAWDCTRPEAQNSGTYIYDGQGVEFNPSHEYIDEVDTSQLPDRIDIFYVENFGIAIDIANKWYGNHTFGIVPDTVGESGVSPTRFTNDDAGSFGRADVVFVSNAILNNTATVEIGDYVYGGIEVFGATDYFTYYVYTETNTYDVYRTIPDINNVIDYGTLLGVEETGVTVSTPSSVTEIEKIHTQVKDLFHNSTDPGDIITLIPYLPIYVEQDQDGFSITELTLTIDVDNLISDLSTSSGEIIFWNINLSPNIKTTETALYEIDFTADIYGSPITWSLTAE